MKYTPVSILLLAGLSEARPKPQFSIPGGFSMPPFSLPPGISFPSGPFPEPTGPGVGPGFSIPSTGNPGSGPGFSIPFPGGMPEPTGDVGGISVPTGGAGLPTVAIPTATCASLGLPSVVPTLEAAVNADCTPQGSTGGSTENGVADKNCCTDLTVIFARGTGETGNVGTIAGPPMFKSLRQKLGDGKVTVQGVDYPADAAGNANQGASGGPAMASSVKAAKSQCPNTKIIVAGYSQGAMVVHNAFSQGVSASDVMGAVLFGDPLKTQSVGDLSKDKVKEFCATQDMICGGGDNPSGSHLSYGSVAGEAADWVISAAGLA